MHAAVRTAILLLLGTSLLCADDDEPSCEQLFRDLNTVYYVNELNCRTVPVTYNHLGQAGLLQMPSARMGPEGSLGISYTHLPPYRHANVRFQFLDRLELSIAYRTFRGIEDPVLSPMGFGDFSDKGANFRVAMIRPEDSHFLLPGVALGADDFTGTRGFAGEYIVLTQVLPRYGLEATLGYGRNRYNGFFGGFNWTPFYRSDYWWARGLTFTAEYDSIDYKDPESEPHPAGREQSLPLNVGLKYRLWEMFDFSIARVRGETTAWSLGYNVDFGGIQGLPKINDRLPYKAPANVEPIGERRSEQLLVQEFLWALREQGITLLEAWIQPDACRGDVLRLVVTQSKYRQECEVRERLRAIAVHLSPEGFREIVFVVDTQALPVFEYRLCVDQLHAYRRCAIGDYELQLFSPVCEASRTNSCVDYLLYSGGRKLFDPYAYPSFQTLLGSSKGKVKFTSGISAGFDGYLPGDVYYSARAYYRLYSDMDTLGDKDRLNPSQIVNVRSDGVCYLQGERLSFPELYLQKHWNMGCGWHSRAAVGYFELAYGGVASELLYYPVHRNWALGFEGAYLAKRKTHGFEFDSRLRKLQGFVPTWIHHSLWQAFGSFYGKWPAVGLDYRVHAGHFLADDWGARVEVGRTYCNGLRVYGWYTRTNGEDMVNGRRYHDHGVGFSLPLDVFYTSRSTRRWNYSLAAWSRDVGAKANTGLPLYGLIDSQR